jgi:hypothetical protein
MTQGLKKVRKAMARRSATRKDGHATEAYPWAYGRGYKRPKGTKDVLIRPWDNQQIEHWDIAADEVGMTRNEWILRVLDVAAELAHGLRWRLPGETQGKDVPQVPPDLIPESLRIPDGRTARHAYGKDWRAVIRLRDEKLWLLWDREQAAKRKEHWHEKIGRKRQNANRKVLEILGIDPKKGPK